MDKGISKIVLVSLIALAFVVATGLFIFISSDDDNEATPTLSPTEMYTTVPTPTIISSPMRTASPTISPTPTVSVKPVVSGIKGEATLKSCVYGSCSTKPVAQMRVDVKTISGALHTTIYTDGNGNFNINLDPGTYIVGPFQDTTTSAKVNEATVKVNKGYFSEVNVKFESTL